MDKEEKKVVDKKTTKNNKKSEIVVAPELNKVEEAKGKESTGVLSFGRFNPPTTGHEKLLDKVHSVAKEHNAMAHVYASHTEGNAKNPLPQEKKIGYLKKVAHKDVNVYGSSKEKPTILHAAKDLHDHGHKHLVVVAGQDRVDHFHSLLNKYNGHKDHYNFSSIKVVSSGDRDPDTEGTKGISGTKMRAHARAGNHNEFKKGLPKALHPHAKEIANHIKSIKEGLHEELIEAALDIVQRRKRAMALRRRMPRMQRRRMLLVKRFADQKKLQTRARKVARQLVRSRVAGKRGAEYHKLTPAAKQEVDKKLESKKKLINLVAKRIFAKVRRREAERVQRARGAKPAQKTKLTLSQEYDNLNSLFEKVSTKVRQDKDIADRKGTQPAKYHKGLAPSTKAARDAQFKKQAKMDDKNPAAYKPAPGDATAKTKPSVYTKMYKDMFGEVLNYDTFNSLFEKVADETLKELGPRRRARRVGYYPKPKKPLPKVSQVKNINPEEEITEKSMEALKSKASKSGYSYKTLKKVYDRGVAAWKTGHRPGTTPQQWGYGRVNAFIAKQKSGKKLDHDTDLANEYIPEQAQQNYNTPAADHKADKIYPYQAAIKDLDLNTKNRNKTIKEYDYGPANPESEEHTKMYWEKKADLWGCSIEMVKTMRCMNCAAFDQKPQTLRLMADGIGPDGMKIVKNANLGFCELFEFKCAGNRTCDAWVGGGPLKESEYIPERGSDYLRLANVSMKKGDMKKAIMYRRAAAAAERGDQTTLQAVLQQIRNLAGSGTIHHESKQLEESFIVDRSSGYSVTYTAKDLGIQTQGGFALHPSVIDEMEENFMDGKNPQDKGDMARHGLKGKSISQLKKIRSSDSASPRKKQLAHWYINMHKGKK